MPAAQRKQLPTAVRNRGCSPLALDWLHGMGMMASTASANCPTALTACAERTSRAETNRAPPKTTPAALVYDITRSGGLGAGNCFMMGRLGTDESKRRAVCTAFAQLLNELPNHTTSHQLQRIADTHGVHLHGPAERAPKEYVDRLAASLRKLASDLSAGKHVHLRCSHTCIAGAACHGDLLRDDAARRASGLSATILPTTATATAPSDAHKAVPSKRPTATAATAATSPGRGGAAQMLWIANTLAQATQAATTVPPTATLCAHAPSVHTPVTQTSTTLVPLLICVAALSTTTRTCTRPQLRVLCPAGGAHLFGTIDGPQLGSSAHEPAIARARQWGGLGRTDGDPHVFLAGEIELQPASTDGATTRTAMRICVLPLFLDISQHDTGIPTGLPSPDPILALRATYPPPALQGSDHGGPTLAFGLPLPSKARTFSPYARDPPHGTVPTG